MALGIVACLALAWAGCGGSSDSTGNDGSQTTPTTESGPPSGGGGEQGGPGTEGGSKEQSGDNGAGGGENGSNGGGNPDREPTAQEAEAFKTPPGGDDSIQTFGTTVEADEEEEIVDSMRAFFRAIANLDYPAMCDGLTSSNRAAFQQYLKLQKEEGSCETVLETLLQKAVAPEARRAANGVVYQVRVEDGNAFVLFTPEGGRASYFVMKEEDGAWKATGLATGTPFDPTAPPTG